ncbi:MAG: OmpH family outer membrane protein [Bacteroidia bacterium]|nr:OmpH family outer membrane protein [Bacteroidia bacterium]
MKLKVGFIAVMCVLLSCFTASAQKLGHINSTELLSYMPATKKADSLIMDFGRSLEQQLQAMTMEYQKKVQDYQKAETSMTDPVKQAKVKEIGDLENRIGEFQESAQESIQKKKEQIYTPIIKKAETAITDVAKEGGYTYIFDSSVGVLLFAQDSDDIMGAVKKKLGLK